MTVFSSLQTLAEKYEEAKTAESISGDSRRRYVSQVELQESLHDAWPLLEAAVKALEGIADVDWRAQDLELVGEFETDARDIFPRRLRHLRETARAALVSLTGEPGDR